MNSSPMSEPSFVIHSSGTAFSLLQISFTSAVPNSRMYGASLLRIKLIIFPVSPSKAAKHSPGSSLEVLLYAIARHMVVGHESALDNLISVGAIALIFVVRKFFFVPAFGAHLPDGKPAPDLTPNQSGIPAEEFRTRLRQRIHAEALADEEDDDEDDETEEV